MPQERSPEHTSVNVSGISNLPRVSETEPRRDQSLGKAPLFPDGTPAPPYPDIIDLDDVTDEHIVFAIQDLLSYVEGMRQRAEQRTNRSLANAAHTHKRVPKSKSP